MLEYPAGRDRRRVTRWMARRGRGIAWVSPQAAQLLATRLAIRHRSFPWLAICWTAGLAAMIYAMAHVPIDRRPAHLSAATAVAAAQVLFATGVAWRLAAVRLAENRLAGHLRLRVATGVRDRVRDRIGTLRAVGLAAAGAINIATWLLLADERARTAVLVAYGGAIVCVFGVTMISIHSLISRAKLAVDPSSLAIDGRLRSADSQLIFLPLTLLLASAPAFAGMLQGPTSMATLFTVLTGMLLLQGLEVLAQGTESRRYTDGPAFGIPPVQT